jgi:phage baseplate assembly protein W
MYGMHQQTGYALAGMDHLRQSITDILTTPIGSRVMRRNYGSRLYEWIDSPINRSTLVEIYAAVADALRRWEPRLTVNRIQVEAHQPGFLQLKLDGVYQNSRLNIDDITITL